MGHSVFFLEYSALFLENTSDNFCVAHNGLPSHHFFFFFLPNSKHKAFTLEEKVPKEVGK